MKSKGTLILTGTVLVLGLYAYFGEYKREINEAEQKKSEAKIVTLKRDQIHKITFDKGVPNPLTVQRTADGWDLLSPIQDQADNEVMEAFLDQVSGEAAINTVGEGSVIKWEQYGLDKPMGSIVLETNSGEKQIITVSMKKNFENLPFLRRNEESRVIIGNSVWTDFLSKSTDHFRNLRVFRSQISKVDTIKVQNSEGQFEIINKDAQWVSVEKPEWKLDQNAVREILTQLSLAKGITLLDKKPQGTSKIILEVAMGDEKWKGQFYKDSVLVSPLQIHISLAPQTLSTLDSITLLGLRDKTVPFKFQREPVTKIKVKNPLKSFNLVKADDKWMLETADSSVVVNSEKAADLIERLHRMEVYKYVKKTPANMPTLASEIELLDQSGQTAFKINWSDFKNHEGWARTNFLDEVFQIDDAQINRLSLNEIVKPKASAKDQSSEKAPQETK